MALKLSDVIVHDKVKEVIYDKDWKVSFRIKFLGRSQLNQLIGKHTKLKFNPLTKQKEESVDSDKLVDELLENCVVGWNGVTYKWLANHIVLDLSKIDDQNAQVEFNRENLEVLVKNSYGIDAWLLETIKNAESFNEKREEEAKN